MKTLKSTPHPADTVDMTNKSFAIVDQDDDTYATAADWFEAASMQTHLQKVWRKMLVIRPC